MRILICTQIIDVKDPILGFFHRWVEEFAKHAEHIHVICLQEGEHHLPQNVTVHSLGKEHKHGSRLGKRLRYIWRFKMLVWRLRREYDTVFVHMNPEYIVLAGWWWRLAGKKIGLWYNHTAGSLWLKAAQPFTNYVFHTSPFAYTARYHNAERMPAGIDTDVFKPQPEIEKIPRSIYFQGRVASAKRVHVMLEAFARLHGEGVAKLLTIVGPEDAVYTKPLKETYRSLIQSGAVVFKGSVPNTETPRLYAMHEVSVNLTDDGNYDKTVLESLACDTPVVTSSKAFADAPVDMISAPEPDLLAPALAVTHNAAPNMREYVQRNHSLAMLGQRIREMYELRADRNRTNIPTSPRA